MFKFVKLKDVCHTKSGGTPSRKKSSYYNNGNIKWAKISDLETAGDGFIYDTEEYITKSGLENINNRLFTKDTLFLAMYGSVGKTAITKNEMSCNQAILGITAKDSQVLNLYYLKYWFDSMKERLLDSARGVALKNISAKIINDLQFPLPSLKTQEHIAGILDDAASLRDKTKQLLEEYDNLAQSIFLDMFGDPVLNSKEWNVSELIEITSKIGSGATPRGGKNSYKEEGISLIRSLNIHDNSFKLKNLAFIDEEQAERLQNVTLEENDVLINITGASVARCAIVPDDILPARVNQHVSILRCKPEKANPVFLLHLIISPNTKIKLLGVGSSGGATRESITKNQLEDFEVVLPPIELQNEFAEKIALIEQQKDLAIQELKESEDLFNCLLQKAFKGELIPESQEV